MDILSNLKYAPKSRRKRKIIARGAGSGRGGTATRGDNGQMSRSGAKHKSWFEGGQMPLQRRVPKYGFTNIFKVYAQTVNVGSIQKLVDAKKLKEGTVNPEVLKAVGLISKTDKPIKILGYGDLKAKFEFEANAFSKSAIEKIKSAGGSIKEI